MPEKLRQQMESAVKEGNYASTSEFIRHLLRLWKDQEILKDIRQSEKEYKQGKFKVLKSVKDLDRAKF
ncbi:MAG: hypothetical protein A3B23_00385 [Candidatus Colwellbacteria bacterium RIFCSPLOWO2_01_FULL_48_10]|nr:MAG: hypothetical protein A3B23_00385 [Candidatus Colwellbacteria bacterium RIFCSPLOWO2_01_FULL_48_10]